METVVLDPEARAVVERLAAARGRSLEDGEVATARRAQSVWLEFAGPIEDVAAVRHTFFVGPTAELPVRVYTPFGEGPFPALAFFHGGGWTLGNVEQSDAVCRALANRGGCVVVAVNYQKAPEHRFPVALDDCLASLDWVVENAGELEVDALQLGVAGESSGANLAAAVCLRARDEGGPSIAFQVLVCPPLDRRFDTESMQRYGSEGFVLTAEAMRSFWDNYLGLEDVDDPYACPLRAPSLAGLSPAVIVVAGCDPLLDDGLDYAAALESAGVPSIVRRYDRQVHGVLRMADAVEAARTLIDDLGRDVRSLARGDVWAMGETH
jgi:acetyl esterase